MVDLGEIKLRTCKNCGKKIPRDSQRRKFCSDECLYQNRIVGNTKKRCINCKREYVADRKTSRFCCRECEREWWKENRDREKDKRNVFTCQNCGKEYKTAFRDRNTCCSRKCGWELRTKKATIKKNCLVCGKSFNEIKSGPGYCSKKCKKESLELEVKCVECGNKFVAGGGVKYCSDECKRARNRREYRKKKMAAGRNGGRIEKIICRHCGKEFTKKIYNAVPQFCSSRCAKRQWIEDNPEKAARNKARQRHTRRAAKYNNGPMDDINPADVFEFDGWVCGICGKKVNKDLSFPHPYSASLDHIVPLSKGGTHTYSNVQLAHFICNSKKRDLEEDQQLRLDLISMRVYGG